MRQGLKSIVTLTICSLLGVLLLQAYFGYQVYQRHTVALEQEVDRVLDKAISTADAARIDRINALFARDIRNPELANLSLRMEDGEPRIFLSDPQTGDIYVSIRFREKIDSAKIDQQLEKEIINYNRNFLEEGSVMYWNDEIGERLSRYSDSIQISKSFLVGQIGKELEVQGIRSGFELLLSNDSIPAETLLETTLIPREAPAKIDGFTTVGIRLLNPGREVLRRSSFVYLMTLVVLLLIVGSFLVLLRFVRRQKRLSRLKDDFIDNVTHELLTPITTLQLALGTLRNDEAMSAPNKYLDVSEQQAQRIAEIVDHVLRVSFLDTRQAGLKKENVNLNQLLEEVLDYHRITTQKPLEIRTELGEERWVYTDPNHLINVLHNLIGNAIKYSPDSGSVLSIGVVEMGRDLRIDVADNGPGIPASERSNIFDKFHRVTNGVTHEVKGMGIGLYYAKRVLEQLGGALALRKTSPSGSTFSITLPIQKDPS